MESSVVDVIPKDLGFDSGQVCEGLKDVDGFDFGSR
jgi:hypothetical protein